VGGGANFKGEVIFPSEREGREGLVGVQRAEDKEVGSRGDILKRRRWRRKENKLILFGNHAGGYRGVTRM